MTAEIPEFTAKEVATHHSTEDAWMVIHGQVYNVTSYLNDHPGGAEVLIETAGTDASEAFDNAGHSEDAFEIMAKYRVGKLKGAGNRKAAKPVKVAAAAAPKPKASNSARDLNTTVGAVAAMAGLGAAGFYYVNSTDALAALPNLMFLRSALPKSTGSRTRGLGFTEGFFLASAVFGVTAGVVSRRLMKLLHAHPSFMNYPPHIKLPKPVQPELLQQSGWLHPTTYQALPLAKKELVAPNTYRFVFELPDPDAVLGLPIGQHVAIAAEVDGKTVSRSYTPVSNNADRGVLELIIKCYPQGQLTGGYLAGLRVGDEVRFRGPKGAMRYRRGACGRRIGMLAGGSGITPMYQLIRAVCEDDRDTTRVSLVYANRAEPDILLRRELDAFARRYPDNLDVYYVLDEPPSGAAPAWAGGVGFVTKQIIADRFPAPGPDSKVMVCGPPGMVSAAKRSLAELGFEKPGSISKMSDQVFLF
ncbi:cytochrome B5 [Hypoxylon sp. FL1284]|nr:cytochrome B5 [Hypoxylon sp. FL1284]